MFGLFKKKEEDLLDESNKICPVCLIRMSKIEKAGVVIDICNKCKGIYLDDGELEKLVEYTNQGNKLEI